MGESIGNQLGSQWEGQRRITSRKSVGNRLEVNEGSIVNDSIFDPLRLPRTQLTGAQRLLFKG